MVYIADRYAISLTIFKGEMVEPRYIKSKDFILYLVIMFLFVGCNQEDGKSVKIFGDTYHKVPTGYSTSKAPAAKKSKDDREAEKEKAIALAKLKSEENLKIAQIEAEAKARVKKIEVEAAKLKVLSEKEVNLESQKIQKAIAFLKEQTAINTKDKDIFINQLIIIASVSILILVLLVYYIIEHKKRAMKMKMEEEKLRHEARMQESAQQHEKISKVLSIVADKDTDGLIKRELISIIRDQQTEDPSLISYTPDEEEPKDEKPQDDDSDIVDIEDEPVSKT